MISSGIRRKAELYAITGIAVFLATLFLASLIIGYSNPPEGSKSHSGKDIAGYALNYSAGKEFESEGRKLDCSGYTKSVYAHFSINLPPSSQEQYKQFGVSPSSGLDKGDLVFFAPNGKTVSHVGIYIGEGKFIHSPGINKEVRIDSLTNSYFKKCFISGGKVKFVFH
ncbi:MAG: C40 family peptidase [Bacteroidales bacterium]|nr:C40 family peptidase [Bacteroidales bacterium]